MALLQSSTSSLNQRLGADLQLPISGSFQDIQGVTLLLQDIQILLLTVPGERVFRPAWGCTLRNQIWENLETAEINGRNSIKTALELYEPRISLLSITSSRNDNTGLIVFTVTFQVKNTDTVLNLVFPFRAGVQLSRV